ncbi:PIN domain-containing protein [Streptomyces sp. NPDC057445]|uniref:PIN domain-containing protein n=1 Tax=Streptomyces sp. NPDC057445 TaxID=3346136 RepID=UPI0036BF5AE4
MIILDANILKGTSLRSPSADVLRAIRATEVERVAVPWIAMEQIAAQQALAYQEKHDAAAAAIEDLRKATPWSDVSPPRKHTAERVRKHWRERYTEIAEVMQTSPSAYQEALYRETNLLAPCKAVNSGKNKTGARDAAIWLTAVEYAREHPQESVYFVSNNPKDFGDGTAYTSPMDRDIRGIEDRFFLVTSLDGVLEKFATQFDASVEDVQALLTTPESYETVLNAAWEARRRYRLVTGSGLTKAPEDSPPKDRTRHGWAPSEAALGEVLEVSAREIGGHKWFTASVRWLLAEEADRRYDDLRDRVAYAWETRVLLSPTATEQGLTILDAKRPGPVTAEEAPRVPAIPLPNADELLREIGRMKATASSAELRQLVKRLTPYLPN